MENKDVNENVILNGKSMSAEDFEKEKKSLTEKKIQLVEIGNNNYTTRMLD
jgi:hypothetical protein